MGDLKGGTCILGDGQGDHYIFDRFILYRYGLGMGDLKVRPFIFDRFVLYRDIIYLDFSGYFLCRDLVFVQKTPWKPQSYGYNRSKISSSGRFRLYLSSSRS